MWAYRTANKLKVVHDVKKAVSRLRIITVFKIKYSQSEESQAQLARSYTNGAYFKSVQCDDKTVVTDTKPILYPEEEPLILGIETSCDDTGVAIVNGSGIVLGEAYFSQVKTSVRLGGVVPSVAKKLHEQNIKQAIHEAFEKSNLTPNMMTAVATSVKPGNIACLKVGAKYGKEFALQHNIPFIPIHHMEAHALTARMVNKIDFPFLVLLVSGGHCLLVVAHSINKWSIIGETLDMSPGSVFDQVARKLKLRNIPGMEVFAGGKAIEVLAQKGDPRKYAFTSPNSKYRNADFSFAGLESAAFKLIKSIESKEGIEGGRVMEEVNDFCASFQYGMTKHLIRQTHKGMRLVEYTQLIPAINRKALVISGGVASNQYLRQAFEKLCKAEEYSLFVPPPHLCTDNGIMVAWNGIERWKSGEGILYNSKDIEEVIVQKKCPLGPNLSQEHLKLNLPNPKWVKL